MQFNPHAEYIGGQLLGAGLSSAGRSIGDALKQYEQDKANAAWGDTTFDWIAKNVHGAVSPDILAKYNKASAKERAQMALGAQWNAVQGMSALARQQAMEEPFVNVNGQLFARPGAPRPVYPTSGRETGVQERFQARENARKQDAQIKLAQSQLKSTEGQLTDLTGGVTDPDSFLNTNLHQGGYVDPRTKKFVQSDPTSKVAGADVTPQTHIRVGPTGTPYDLPTFNRIQALARQRQQLNTIINTGLQQQAGVGGGGAGAGGGIVTVNNPAEAQKLPPGTRYRAPDGKVRIIPGTATTTSAGAGTGYDYGDGGDTTDEEDYSGGDGAM
jgi:hypothetical protein